MRTATTLIFIVLPILSVSAQTKDTAPSSVNSKIIPGAGFSTAGEQENYWAQELFAREYNKQIFKRVKIKASIGENTIQYDDGVLKTDNLNPAIKLIFTKGIFYPGIISEERKSEAAGRNSQPDSLGNGQKHFNAAITTDTFRVTAFEELRFLAPSPQIKRFRFWLFTEGFANPVVYFIELTNPKATAKTDIEDFIDGSALTFYKNGWVIL